MTRYECPACDGDDIEVTERLIQELDPVSKTVLRSEFCERLLCRHCGWSGKATEALPMGRNASEGILPRRLQRRGQSPDE